MSTPTVSPLRQRMIEDMNARKLCAGTQRGHIRSCQRFAAFLKRSPDTATTADIRLSSCTWRRRARASATATAS
jgi:integrase/recombinase XerD